MKIGSNTNLWKTKDNEVWKIKYKEQLQYILLLSTWMIASPWLYEFRLINWTLGGIFLLRALLGITSYYTYKKNEDKK